MTLIPVNNARELRFFGQLIKWEFYANRPKTNCLRSVTNSQHGYTFSSEVRFAPQFSQTIALAMVLGNHTQARWAAVHHI